MPNVFAHGHALLIGVGADLPTTVQDATALQGILVDPDRAAYSPKQVELLCETNANRQSILDAFDGLSHRVDNDSDATVIVYFSGHGGRVELANHPPEYFLVPYGYDPSQRSQTAISGQEFTSKIEEIKAHKLVILLDCCHAAGVPALKEPGEVFIKSALPPDLLNVLETGSGRVVIASSREDEYSYTGMRYSIFTDCLIDALSGNASVHKDGFARILDILIYLFQQVPQRAPGPQHPFVKKVLDLGDNFPLCYYGGFSKYIPSVTSYSEPALITTCLMVGQRQRIEQRYETLHQEWDLRSEKIKRMRKEMVIQTSVIVTFQLEQQLLDEEAQLARLGDQIEKIEQQLRQ